MKLLQILAVLAVAAGPLHALEDEVREIPLAQLEATGLEPGKKVKVTGKYRELVDQELVLHDCKVPFLLKRPDLLRKILDFRPERDNLILSGQVVEAASGFAIEVGTLTMAPSDLEVFTHEAEKIPRKESQGARDLFQLSKRVLAAHKRHRDPDLLPLARSLFSESLERLEAGLDAEKLEAHLAFIREMHQSLNDREIATEALIRIQRKFPRDEGVEAFLKDLNCKQYRGRWVTYEEFKEAEGLVFHSGRWISTREKHLLDCLEWFKKHGESDLVIRKRTDRDYQRLAEKGSVDLGMKPAEVYLALGFPDRVERRSYQQQEFDQWSYGAKYYYFYAGLLVIQPEE